MTLPAIDLNDAASTAAAEGKFALASGDTPLARGKYGQAGRLLEEQIASALSQTEKHLLRFLAASQYYHGGHYGKALKLCQRVELRLLPAQVKHLFEPFFRDIERRASKEYPRQINDTLVQLWQAGRYADILDRLKEHPYALDAKGLATVRAAACEELRQYKAAALFHATAIRYSPGDPDRLLTSAPLPLELCLKGRLDEAWEYVGYLLEAMPNVMTYTTASLVCRDRAFAVPGWEQQRAILREQLDYFEKAWREFQSSPAAIQNDSDLRRLMGICFNYAAFAFWILGDKKRAKDVCDTAIEFMPSTLARVMRGVVTYPGEQALADLREAAEQDDKTYVPYYLLAHDAIRRGNSGEAREWVKKAVANAEDQRLEAQLHNWLAACTRVLGSLDNGVDTLFLETLAIDPTKEEVSRYYRSFLSAKQVDQSKLAPVFNSAQVDVVSIISRMNSGRQPLQPVGA